MCRNQLIFRTFNTPNNIFLYKQSLNISVEKDIIFLEVFAIMCSVGISAVFLISAHLLFFRPPKRKLIESKGIPQESITPRKVKKIEDVSASLSVQEAEALAMQLLKSKRK